MTNWDKIAASYNAVLDSRKTYVFSHVRRLVVESQPRTLLDFGCGDGLFSVSCAALIPSIFNYDISPGMLSIARSNCAPLKNIQVIDTLESLASGSCDVVTLNAVWMCLSTNDDCLNVLGSVMRVLAPKGRFIASFTHPCFRDQQFSTYKTDFDQRNYLSNGTRFKVQIFDGSRHVELEDTHWNFSAMSHQLEAAGFAIRRLTELADAPPGAGSPWTVLSAIKDDRLL